MTFITSTAKPVRDSSGALATGRIWFEQTAQFATDSGVVTTTRGFLTVTDGIITAADGGVADVPATPDGELTWLYHEFGGTTGSFGSTGAVKWAAIVPDTTTIEYSALLPGVVPPSAGVGVPSWAAEVLAAVDDAEAAAAAAVAAAATAVQAAEDAQSGGGGGGSWGSITGTLADQTDLQAALADKADLDGSGKLERTQLPDMPGVTSAFIGQLDGAVVQPAKLHTPYDRELWALSNFRSGYNTSTLTPSITANGSSQSVRTLVKLGNLANRDRTFRVQLRIDSMPSNGWGDVSLLMVDSGGNMWAGSTRQALLTNGGAGIAAGPWYYSLDVSAGPWAQTGDTYLEVRLDVAGNTTTGTMAISQVSVKEVPAQQRPMRYGFDNSFGPCLYQSFFDATAGVWRMARTLMNDDGALSKAIVNITGFSTDRPFRRLPPDPMFLDAYQESSNEVPSTEIVLPTGEFERSVRVGNNDQIFNVRKSDGNYELRGNTHNGETIRAGAENLKFEADAFGDGTWRSWDGLNRLLRDARKFRFVYNTQVARSAPDSDVVANVDHTATFFPDGMMRMDRTTTFVKAVVLSSHFEWMSSHDVNTPKLGRIGNGLIVEDEVDTFVKVARPGQPTLTPSGTGGVLAAGSYNYQVTALGQGGESTASLPAASNASTTGTTSKVTVAWSAVTGATGYRVYGRSTTNGTRVLLATVGPAVLSWEDTGSQPASGPLVPLVNTARNLSALSSTQDAASSGTASWAVWYDPILNICYGNIYDREALADRAGIASVKVRLERGDGIKKNYINLSFVADGSPLSSDDVAEASRTFAAGTVWSATHWAYTYTPSDPAQYHLEIAARAADLSVLKLAYPA